MFGEGWVRRLNLLFNHLTEDRIDIEMFGKPRARRSYFSLPTVQKNHGRDK